MTRYLIGLFLCALVLAIEPAHAQTTSTSTSSSSTTSTSTTTSTSSTSNTVPCLANGQPCGLNTDCCSGICGDFGLCVATSTTTTSSSTSTLASTTSTSAAPTTSTSTTTTTSTSTTSTTIKIDPQGCLVVAQADDGPSETYVWPDPDRAMAIHFYVDAGASTSTQIEVSQDMVTWIPVGAAITADGTTTIQQPSGIYRVTSTTATGTVTVCYGMSLPR